MKGKIHTVQYSIVTNSVALLIPYPTLYYGAHATTLLDSLVNIRNSKTLDAGDIVEIIPAGSIPRRSSTANVGITLDQGLAVSTVAVGDELVIFWSTQL
jgi:hypothetical protein